MDQLVQSKVLGKEENKQGQDKTKMHNTYEMQADNITWLQQKGEVKKLREPQRYKHKKKVPIKITYKQKHLKNTFM